MHYEPNDGVWQIGGAARLLFEIKEQMTPEQYTEAKLALQEFLYGYFGSGDCNHALGDSISPLKATPNGGKVLKVRWALPGAGKSGSLRLVVVAYCEERRVHIAQAFSRRDNPFSDDFHAAAEDY